MGNIKILAKTFNMGKYRIRTVHKVSGNKRYYAEVKKYNIWIPLNCNGDINILELLTPSSVSVDYTHSNNKALDRINLHKGLKNENVTIKYFN